MDSQGQNMTGLYQLLQDLLHFLQELDRKGAIPDENYETYTLLLDQAKRRVLDHYQQELEKGGDDL
ncbi:MAG: hypothetical protein AB8I40_11645 [Anaerolineales bacterium]